MVSSSRKFFIFISAIILVLALLGVVSASSNSSSPANTTTTLNIVAFAAPEDLLMSSGYGPTIAKGHSLLKDMAARYRWNLTILHGTEDLWGDSPSAQWYASNTDVFVHFMTVSWQAYTTQYLTKLKDITLSKEVGHVLIHSSMGANADPKTPLGRWVANDFSKSGNYLGRCDPKFQTARVTIAQPSHPVMEPVVQALGGNTTWILHEEIYSWDTDIRTRGDVEVLMTVDENSVIWRTGIPEKIGLNSTDSSKKVFKDGQIPHVWTHRSGPARIFACVFAELEATWEMPAYYALFENGVKHVIPEAKKAAATVDYSAYQQYSNQNEAAFKFKVSILAVLPFIALLFI